MNIDRPIGSHWVAAATLLCLLGFADESAAQRTDRNPSPPQVSESPYFLPATSYAIQARFELKSCPGRRSTNSAGRVHIGRDDLVVGAVATVTEVVGRDATLVPHLPFSSGSNLLSTVNAKITFTNGSITQINSETEDRTGQIILNIISAVGSLLHIPASLHSDAGTEQVVPYCTSEALTALSQKDRLQAQIEAAREHIAAIDVSDANAETDLTRYEGLITSLQQQLGALVEQRLSVMQTAYLRPTLDPTTWRTTVAPTDADLARLVTPDGLVVMHDNARPAVVVELVVHNQSLLAATGDADTALRQASHALILRAPVPALLRVCSVDPCPVVGNVNEANVLASSEVLVPQLGLFSMLDMRSRLFDHRTVNIDLSPVGELASIEFKSDARAELASHAAGDIISGVNSARQSQTTRATEALQQHTAWLNAQSDDREAQRRFDAVTAGSGN